MELKITEKKEEPLLSRVLITAEAAFENATPSNKEVKAKLASALKADEKLIVIKHIYTGFVQRKAKVIAYVYSSEEEQKKIEPKEKKPKQPKTEEKQ